MSHHQKNIYRNVLRISMNTIKQNSFQNDYLFKVLCCRKALQIMACVYIYSDYNSVNSSIVVDNDSFYTTWIIQYQHRPTYILILWNTGLLFYNRIKQKPQVKHCTFNVWSYLFRYANYRKRRMIILCNISKTVSCLSIKEKSAATCATYET